jgi:hypothetical protein
MVEFALDEAHHFRAHRFTRKPDALPVARQDPLEGVAL